MNDNISQLVSLCKQLGSRPDLFQGGGGNVSVKLDDQVMAIKASGFRIAEITEEKGLVNMDFPMIRKFYTTATHEKAEELDPASAELIKTATFPDQSGRPSIEAGFHALLGRFVIHSHSVYANLIACADNSGELLTKIFPANPPLLIPFAPPGFYLTLEVKESLAAKPNATVLFLKSHGLVVSAETAAEALTVHEQVSAMIKKHFQITDTYPEISIINIGNGQFKSATHFLSDFMATRQNYFADLASFILFPDQTVFCTDKNKIKPDPDKNLVIYNTSETEAKTIEEILVAWAYILFQLEKINLKPTFLPREKTDFISNMESEKYRQNLVK